MTARASSLTAKNLGWAGTVPKLEYRREILKRLVFCAASHSYPLTLRQLDPGNSTAKVSAALQHMECEGWCRRIGDAGQTRNYVLTEGHAINWRTVAEYFPEHWPAPLGTDVIRLYRGQLMFELE